MARRGRMVFAGGSDDYRESVGLGPAGAARRRARRRRGRDMFDSDPTLGETYEPSDPFDESEREGIGTTPYAPPTTPTQPTPPPMTVDDWVKKFMLSPGRFENMLGDLISGAGVNVPTAPAMPTFEDMFESYNKASRWKQDQEIAGLNEAFGSRGARYGSDILSAQGNLRSRFLDESDLRAKQYLTDIETQRQGREGLQQGWLSAKGNLINAGMGAEQNRQALAWAQAFADFMRQAGPPAGMGG